MADLLVVPAEGVSLSQKDLSWLRGYLMKQYENRPRPGDEDFSGLDSMMLPLLINQVPKLWKMTGGDPTLEEILADI